jgi:tRNA1Val (adenine37-N6)-methyltransferase
MANNWFAFKKFTVLQEKSAMKVGTDGVLLGVGVPDGSYRRILDVGTGTGLVALMLAQRFEGAAIDAVEIDKDAASEAELNFANSPWQSRMSVVNSDFLDFNSPVKYDLIVSNPPYFKNSLQSGCRKRTTARHDNSLPLGGLTRKAATLLCDHGLLVLILPFGELDDAVEHCSQNGFFLIQTVKVRPRADKPYKRVILVFSLNRHNLFSDWELVIESDVRYQYTCQFKTLTGDFYLDK